MPEPFAALHEELDALKAPASNVGQSPDPAPAQEPVNGQPESDQETHTCPVCGYEFEQGAPRL